MTPADGGSCPSCDAHLHSPRRLLVRAVLALLLKIALLAALYFLFFPPSHRPSPGDRPAAEKHTAP